MKKYIIVINLNILINELKYKYIRFLINKEITNIIIEYLNL